MKDGLYHVNFRSNQQDFGVGVITVKDGRVNGGDYAYFYQGKLSEDSALLKITRHNDQATSVFGPIKEFHLELKSNGANENPVYNGFVQGQMHLQIQIHTRFLAPLV